MSTTPAIEEDSFILDCYTSFGSRPKEGAGLSCSALASELGQRGVDAAVSLSLQGVFYDYQEGNTETLVEAKRSDGFIVPAGTIDPRRFYGSGGDICYRDFATLRLFPKTQGWPIDYAPFHKILQKAASFYTPIMIEAVGPGKPTLIARAIGSAEVPVILTSVNYSVLSEVLVLLSEHENLYVVNDMLNTPDGIELICDEVGPERLLFGSNYPITYFEGPKISIEKAEIPASHRRKILGGNARRIMGIK